MDKECLEWTDYILNNAKNLIQWRVGKCGQSRLVSYDYQNLTASTNHEQDTAQIITRAMHSKLKMSK